MDGLGCSTPVGSVFQVWRRRLVAAPALLAKDIEKKPNRLSFLRELVMF